LVKLLDTALTIQALPERSMATPTGPIGLPLLLPALVVSVAPVGASLVMVLLPRFAIQALPSPSMAMAYGELRPPPV
jgi:hypothetical protein